MKKIFFDEKSGEAKLRIESLDDLWYVSQLIDPGDIVSGKTFRKIKMGGEGEKSSTDKKPVFLSLIVEKMEFSKTDNSLRILGTLQEAKEDIPKGSYHSISVIEQYELTLKKQKWLSFHKERLSQATQKRESILIVIMDREKAVFALTKDYGHEILSKHSGDVQKKDDRAIAKGSFYEEVINIMRDYSERYKSQHIVLASPAFWKEDLLKQLKDPALKKKLVSATCYEVSESAVKEVLSRPEVQTVLKQERSAKELKLVGELLERISKKNKVAYGINETEKSAEAGSVESLLVTTTYIQSKRIDNTYERLDQLFQLVDVNKGMIHIISSDHEGGKTLDGLGGVAGLLRY